MQCPRVCTTARQSLCVGRDVGIALQRDEFLRQAGRLCVLRKLLAQAPLGHIGQACK